MVLKIYGPGFAPCVRFVAHICNELHIPYELIPLDLRKGEQKSQAYLEKHPFGKVPVLDDNGFEIYESRAICRYLAAKVGSPLLPNVSNIQAYARFETAASIEYSNFDPFAYGLVFETVIKPLRGLEPDLGIVTANIKALSEKFAVYEVILSKQKYLAGNELTLADLFHCTFLYMAEKAGYDFFEGKPNFARWWRDISSRPAWQAVKDGA